MCVVLCVMRVGVVILSMVNVCVCVCARMRIEHSRMCYKFRYA